VRVKEHLALLVRLQHMDDRIAVQQRRLESIPGELSEAEARFAAKEAAAEQFEAEKKSCLIRAQDLENTVSIDEERIAKIEDQLNRTRDAGAIQIAQHEATGLRERVSSHQEEALRLLEEADGLTVQRDQARAEVAEQRAELGRFRTIVASDLTELGQALEDIKAERENLIQPLTTKGKDLYQKIFEARNRRAVVPLRSGACGGCGMGLSPNDQLKVKAAKGFFQCRSCSCILVEQDLWSAAVPNS
jgi:uncharacterized protein